MEEKELLKEALDKSLLYYMDLEEMEAELYKDSTGKGFEPPYTHRYVIGTTNPEGRILQITRSPEENNSAGFFYPGY